MSVNIRQTLNFPTEISINSAALTGGYDLLGSLTENPIHIIFDNQSDTAIGISFDASTIWHTFPAGEAIILDLRANHGIAPNLTMRKNTSFYAIGTAGTGIFSISYTYAD